MLRLLVNADVWAPEPLGRGFLLIGGGEILAVGSGRPELPRGVPCTVDDLDGMRVVPGFIDAHLHLTGGGGESGPATRVPPLMLSELTRAGVTTAVGVLGTDDLTRDPLGLLVTARAIAAEGLTTFVYTGGYHVPVRTITGSVRGDIVAIAECIGVGEVAISDHRSSQPTVAELLRIAGDAHVAGLMTGKAGLLHLHVGDGERGLDLVRQCLQSEIPARTFHPTHVNRNRVVFAEALDLVRAHGCSIDLTAFPKDDDPDVLSAADAWERYQAVGHALDRLTISSDGGGCMPRFATDGTPLGFGVGSPSSLVETFVELVGAGHRLDVVLPAFTQNVARLLRFARKGRIAVGMDADLIGLGSDHRPAAVLARGTWLVEAGRPTRWGAFETARPSDDEPRTEER